MVRVGNSLIRLGHRSGASVMRVTSDQEEAEDKVRCSLKGRYRGKVRGFRYCECPKNTQGFECSIRLVPGQGEPRSRVQ